MLVQQPLAIVQQLRQLLHFVEKQDQWSAARRVLEPRQGLSLEKTRIAEMVLEDFVVLQQDRPGGPIRQQVAQERRLPNLPRSEQEKPPGAGARAGQLSQQDAVESRTRRQGASPRCIFSLKICNDRIAIHGRNGQKIGISVQAITPHNNTITLPAFTKSPSR